jgi:hypothetical protein
VGIESDQLVFDYLSRVGDAAQRHLPSAARMRLVSELRGEIDRRRAKAPADTPASVRRILTRLGTPDEVVAAERDRSGGGSSSRASVPGPPTGEPYGAPVAPAAVPRPRPSEPEPGPSVPVDAPSPPHLASEHELGDSSLQPDWWRVESGPHGFQDRVPGFTGGIEIPEILAPPPRPDRDGAEAGKGTLPAQGGPVDGAAAAVTAAGGKVPARRRILAGLRRRAAGERTAGRPSPVLLVAAASLVYGAVSGNLLGLAFGWLIVWASGRMSPAESRRAILIVPGVVVAAVVVWFWGRADRHWGAPIAADSLGRTLTDSVPWMIRAAAVASALYVLWRARRAA